MGRNVKGAGLALVLVAVTAPVRAEVGGVVQGKLKGQTEGIREWFHRPTSAWDIDFTASLRPGR